jgi:hypothetical protein
MEGLFPNNEDGGSEEQRNRVRTISGETCLFQKTALQRSSSSDFVKCLDGINLRGAPKRARR